MSSPLRRDFLRVMLGSTVGARVALGQGAPAPITVTKLSDDLVMFAGDGGNVTVVVADDGLMMIDGGLPERSSDLLRSLSPTGFHPVRVLFNTHWHFDHTGCNEMLGKQGVKIIAHENTKKWLSQKVTMEAMDRTFDPLAVTGRPTETFSTSGKMAFGKERIEYVHVPTAHTDSDAYLFFPGPNVIHAGDLFFNGLYPVIDYSTGGWVGGMAAACDTLLRVGDSKTRIIPGHGPIATKADLRNTRSMLWSVTRRLQEIIKQEKSIDDAVRMVPTKDYDATYGTGIFTPDAWVRVAYTSVVRHDKKA